jgi:hypothetical protein
VAPRLLRAPEVSNRSISLEKEAGGCIR